MTLDHIEENGDAFWPQRPSPEVTIDSDGERCGDRASARRLSAFIFIDSPWLAPPATSPTITRSFTVTVFLSKLSSARGTMSATNSSLITMAEKVSREKAKRISGGVDFLACRGEGEMSIPRATCTVGGEGQPSRRERAEGHGSAPRGKANMLGSVLDIQNAMWNCVEVMRRV